eukprot:snap_masked-scaffold_12-processed-gene-10.37-mRNA-1 protein AED:1.00 eAED:1.00 QI:0/-1/0/0/-1/1/1/0/73
MKEQDKFKQVAKDKLLARETILKDQPGLGSLSYLTRRRTTLPVKRYSRRVSRQTPVNLKRIVGVWDRLQVRRG